MASRQKSHGGKSMAGSSDRPPAVHVHWYLNDAAPAIRRLFYVLVELLSGDSEKVQRIRELEDQRTFSLILGYGDVGKIDEETRDRHRKEAADHAKQLASIDLELDTLRNGEEGKTLAVASVAAGIIFIAHHGIEIGEKHGRAVDGREVIVGYNLKEFIVQARNHAAHFAEMEPHPPREKFQKQVLNYDQRAERTTVNHSFRLLEILRWRTWNDIRKDLLSLFNPTGERLDLGRFQKLRKLPGYKHEPGAA
jgi:hypothetical protein